MSTNDKWGLHKIKWLLHSKGKSWLSKGPTFKYRRKVFAIYLLNRGLVSRIDKKFKNLITKTSKQLYPKKWVNEMNTQFSGDEAQMPSKTSEETCLAVLAIPEM